MIEWRVNGYPKMCCADQFERVPTLRQPEEAGVHVGDIETFV